MLVDLVGAFAPNGLSYVPTDPVRLVDTRDDDQPVTAGSGVEYDLGARSALDARAAFVNVTAVGHTTAGYTSTFACDQLPDTSTLNQFVGRGRRQRCDRAGHPVGLVVRLDAQRRPPGDRPQRVVGALTEHRHRPRVSDAPGRPTG